MGETRVRLPFGGCASTNLAYDPADRGQWRRKPGELLNEFLHRGRFALNLDEHCVHWVLKEAAQLLFGGKIVNKRTKPTPWTAPGIRIARRSIGGVRFCSL